MHLQHHATCNALLGVDKWRHLVTKHENYNAPIRNALFHNDIETKYSWICKQITRSTINRFMFRDTPLHQHFMTKLSCRRKTKRYTMSFKRFAKSLKVIQTNNNNVHNFYPATGCNFRGGTIQKLVYSFLFVVCSTMAVSLALSLRMFDHALTRPLSNRD